MSKTLNAMKKRTTGKTSKSNFMGAYYGLSAVSCAAFFIEVERRRVDAIAQSGRLRPVLEYVPQMRVTAAAHGFSPAHAVARVIFGGDVFGHSRSGKARPARAGIELVIG